MHPKAVFFPVMATLGLVPHCVVECAVVHSKAAVGILAAALLSEVWAASGTLLE